VRDLFKFPARELVIGNTIVIENGRREALVRAVEYRPSESMVALELSIGVEQATMITSANDLIDVIQEVPHA
jgi:hypothetical protein